MKKIKDVVDDIIAMIILSCIHISLEVVFVIELVKDFVWEILIFDISYLICYVLIFWGMTVALRKDIENLLEKKDDV